jgi:hypothetical protein
MTTLGDTVTYQGSEWVVKQLEIRGFGEEEGVWVKLLGPQGQQRWVKKSEIQGEGE